MGQRVAVVVKYIDEHPEDLHLEFWSLAREALRASWPCKP
jgi:Rap1a immunity proteins